MFLAQSTEYQLVMPSGRPACEDYLAKSPPSELDGLFVILFYYFSMGETYIIASFAAFATRNFKTVFAAI